MNKLNIADLRRNYTKGGLQDDQLPENPVELFETWLEQAMHSEVMEPNAMSLATANNGTPNVRTVLLKGIEENALHFYTNYNSDKVTDIEKNPEVAVVFWWPELERQVRVNGKAEKLTDEENEVYFKTRPRESQLGAWASDQSRPVKSREELEKKFREVEAKFNGQEIPKPEYWGGFAIKIEMIEFWQGRSGRLHDRIQYTLENNSWKKQRLQP